MSDYGVPADAAGALPWTWAEQRLVENRNFWLVSASASGRPHALPVWGVWMVESERFWFSCSPRARKARNIAENPACVVAVDDTIECISVEGRARLVEPADEAPAVEAMIRTYLEKYWPDPTVHVEMEEFIRRHAMFEVTPERAFGIIERDEEFAQRATRWSW